MPTVIIRPNATPADFGSTLVGASTAHEALYEVTADDSTTYVIPDTASGPLLSFEQIPTNATVQEIKIYYRFNIPSGTRNVYVVAVDSTLTKIYFGDSADVSGSWQDRDSGTLTTNPVTGVAFTAAEINDIQVFLSTFSSSNIPEYTQLYIEVKYTVTDNTNALIFAGN